MSYIVQYFVLELATKLFMNTRNIKIVLIFSKAVGSNYLDAGNSYNQ